MFSESNCAQQQKRNETYTYIINSTIGTIYLNTCIILSKNKILFINNYNLFSLIFIIFSYCTMVRDGTFGVLLRRAL